MSTLHGLKDIFGKKKAEPAGYTKGLNILDEYSKEVPSDQLAIDLFEGEWSCSFPDSIEVVAGSVPLFEDGRVEWVLECLGDVKGKRVLELGPLEAAHSYILEKAGVDGIISVEAHKRAYLKCLVVKELMGLSRTRFLLGDFNRYMEQTTEKFDICFASGVLYHMLNPAETIQLASTCADSIFIWSHYYDKELLQNVPEILKTMGGSKPMEHQGYEHTLYEHFYNEFVSVKSFCGGSNPTSYWMDREGMIGCLKYFGFTDVQVGVDEPNHPSGPAFCLVGRKEKA